MLRRARRPRSWKAGRGRRRASNRTAAERRSGGAPRPRQVRGARTERVVVREEAADEAVGALRLLDLRRVAAALQRDLLRLREPAADVAAETGRDQLVV